MALAFIIAGLILGISGIQGTQLTLFSTVKKEITGGFGWWFLAIVIVGLFGYVPKLQGFSIALIVLIFASIIVANKSQIVSELNAFTQSLPVSGSTLANGITPQSGAAALAADFNNAVAKLGM